MFYQSFPRAKKFQKKSFPLFDALGELYDGHIAQGTWNITSTQLPQEWNTISNEEEQVNTTRMDEEGIIQQQPQEEDSRLEQDEDPIIERTEQRSTATRRSTASTINQDKEAKRMKKDSLEGLVGRYLDLKSKQVEDEVTQMAKGKESAQGNDFSIMRCISVLRSMNVIADEKIKAAEVFDIPNNRETFISFSVDEPETALLWLRRKMDKL